MAATYKGKITRNTDWGGDASTGGLPVAGSSVQNFLKDEIGGKIGAVYKPEGGTNVYYFANEEDKQAYIETGNESLIIDSFEMASNYSVEIDRDGLVLSHSVIEGATGNTVDFGFKIVDENDMAADARARIEFSFTGSGISNKFTTEVAVNAGDWTRVSTNIDEYLRSGSNSVAIKIVGLSTQATSQFVMTYNLFNLKFTPMFPYNEVQTGRTISIPFVIECSDTKYLEFYIDGQQVSSLESMVISDIRYDGRSTLDISNLSVGQHSLQFRAYVKATDGTLFYTPSHFYTFAKYGEAEPSFLMHKEMANTEEIVAEGEELKIKVAQFEQIMFDWAIYDYRLRRLIVNFEYDGEIVTSSVIDENGKENTFNYRPMNFGEGKQLRIFAVGEDDETIFEHTIGIDVEETSSGIKETTDGLLLKLQATGRRNTDENKDVWDCTGSDGNRYYATFSGFSWSSQQGWNEETESLVISNGATVEFNIQPMINDWARQGGTLEVDLETFDIEDEDAVICECMDKTGNATAYFKITATNAEFSTAQGVKIGTRYKDNERLKIAFIGNKFGDSDDDKLIYIVINGVLERAALYTSNQDQMYSSAKLVIGNPDGLCKVRLRSIRVYNRAISVDQAFNNFVVDSDDVQGLYEKNNVLKEGSVTEIGFDEVANKLPVMIFTGDMNELVTEGQTSKMEGKWYDFDVEYINRQEPERNFVSFNCKMKLQGTSSLGYPRKNFKLKTKDKNFNEDLYNASRYELDPTSVVGNRMLRDKRTGERIDFDDFKTNGTVRNTNTFTLDYQGKPLKKGKYRFRKDAHKAQKWTLKADFMESSCSHNVGAGRSWNDIFENTELLNNGEASYTNQTYKDSALVSGASRDYIEYNGYNIEGTPTHYKIPYNSQAIKDQKKYVCRTDAQKICIAAEQDDIRTAVDGFPMVCFYRTSHAANDLVFIGQYNFINDKGSYEVFGFEDIEDPTNEETMIYDASKVECWEGLKNTNPLSLFKTDEGFYDWNVDGTLRKWAETYEARYPDPEDYDVQPSALYELTKWLVSTRHVSGETQYSGKINIDASFARRINTYQYGYTDDTAASYAYVDGEFDDSPEARQKKFETEKWEHFDVWKVAGYYVYLRRYGAVDQFVKNTMLFTDGNGKYDPREDIKYRKWFFINYDNDCLFGLRNNGQLAFHWDLDRQTIDSASDILIDDQADDEGAAVNTYAMMGHDSTLWNNLEADDEFMRMVRDLDYSMTKYKLNYDNMVKEFDTNQTEMWCERIYNANERYKYINAAKGIGDMAGRPVNNLWMLQGTRRSHRHWWIANHFNLLDAQWLSGDYKNTYVELKTNCHEGTTVRCIAGQDFYFAWGQQKKIYESNMVRKEGDEILFSFPTDQSQGDPVYIYAFNKMTEMDFSELASLAFGGSYKFVLGNDLVQNSLKKLVIGNPNVINRLVSDEDTATWINVPNLEYVDITNFEGIASVPIESFKNLHTFKAFGSKLGSFAPAEGSRFDLVELPASIKSLSMTDISFTRSLADDFNYTPNTNLDRVTISKSYRETTGNKVLGGVELDYYNNILLPWVEAINASPQAALLYTGKSLILRNVNWVFNNLDSIRIFKNFKNSRDFQISGRIDLRACGNLSMENINEIKEIFGENCFNERLSPLYVMTPDSVFIGSENDNMVAGQTNIFTRSIYPDERAIVGKLIDMEYYIVEETNIPKEDAGERTIFRDPIRGKNYLVIDNLESVRRGITLTNTVDGEGKQIGVLQSDELVLGTDSTFLVLVSMVTMGASTDKISIMPFTIKDTTYGDRGTISGLKSLYSNGEYRFILNPRTADGQVPIGSYNVSWSLTGAAVSQYVESYNVDENNQLEFIVRMNQSQPEISSKMTVVANITNHDGTTYRVSYAVLALNENVIMTSDSNPVAMLRCYEAGFANNGDAMTKAQAEAVTDLGSAFRGINTAFTFDELVFFTGLTSLPTNAFANSRITEIVIPETVENIGAYCFDGCSMLENVYVEKDVDGVKTYVRTLPSGITTINEGIFRGCSSLSQLELPENVTEIKNYAFGGTGFRRAILPTTEMVDGDLKFNQALAVIDGYVFETVKWSPETTNNQLRHLEIPANMRIRDFSLVYGRNYESFVVDDENESYSVSEEGVLLSRDELNQTLLRYPPKAPALETYVMPPVLYVDKYSFFGVQNLTNLIAAQTVQIIGEGFCRDSKIEVVDLSTCHSIANGEIPQDSFRNASMLRHAYLPMGSVITRIGTHAFDGCVSLEEIELPVSLTEFAVDSSGWSYTFVGCSSVSAVTFPDNVSVMGRSVLRNMNGLKKIVFPAFFKYTEGFTSDTMQGFAIAENCPNVESITLPAFTVTKVVEGEDPANEVVNEYVFTTTWYVHNPPVTGEQLLGTVEGIGLVWNGLSNLKEVLISDRDNGAAYISVDGVIYSANRVNLMYGPKAISAITIDPATKNIMTHAFNSSSLRTVVLPEGLETIGEGAFKYAPVENINFPRSLRGIGREAFAASRMRELNIGNDTYIGNQSFENNSVLEVLRMRFEVNNDATQNIGKFAFRNCSRLKEVYVSCEIAPTIEETADVSQASWHQFVGAGSAFADAERKLYVSYGTSHLYPEASSGLTWNWLFIDPAVSSHWGRNLVDGFALSGYCYVTIFQNGTPYTGETIYAKSAANNLVGNNGSTYSTTLDDGKYMFELDGVFDNERITVYSDSDCTNALGSFVPRLFSTEYQIGEMTFGLRKSSARMFSSSILRAAADEPQEEEKADITKSEYEALVSKVNQMMRILKKMVK